MTRVARHSTEAEIAALEAFCDTLNRFGADLALEWLDGYMTAIAVSRRPIGIDEWLPRLCGDDFDRAFGDPESAAQAKATLMTRFQALASQLDAESIADDPETLRLSPLMVQYDDAARAEIVAAGHMTADEAAEDLLTGALWAEGFYDAVEAFADDWPDADDNDPDAAWYDDALSRVMLLALPQSELNLKIREFFPDDPPSRDELVDEACWSVQDLKLYWVDHAPRPATRRVEPTPGRNDPCPCGSGKKYKKCHGAATAG